MQVQPHTRSLIRQPNASSESLASSLIRATDVREQDLVQLRTDLSALPEPWLRRFSEKHVAVAVLKDNQTLADTPVLLALDQEAIQELKERSASCIHEALGSQLAELQAIEDPGERAYALRLAGPEFEEKLQQVSEEEGLGFGLELGREAVDLSYLAQKHGFDPEYEPEAFSTWSEVFKAVNADLMEDSRPRYGFVVIPYVQHRGKPVRTLSLPSYQSITGLQFQNNLGGAYPQNHLVVLHESVVPNPSPKAGRHRVSLHEMGHLLDHFCRDLEATRDTHERKVSQLFHIGHQRQQESTPDSGPFLTSRAADSPGEMMAEAVEAYLTVAEPGENNFYKSENHRDNLAQRFPELYEYVDHLMQL